MTRKLPDPDQMPTISRKEALILHLLIAKRDLYGLELVDRSKGKLKRGTVYVTLNRMEEKGFVESSLDPAPTGYAGLPRRRYRATGAGVRVLQALEIASRAVRFA